MMKTNELKKGCRILLRNGWQATLEDNAKGNIRMATVYGDYTEMGSIYSHDIVGYMDTPKNFGYWHRDIEYTPSQLKCRKMSERLFA